PFGDLKALWESLMNSRSAIQPVRRFATDAYNAGIASCFEDLAPKEGRSLVREVVARLLSQLGPVSPQTWLITATTKSGIDNLERTVRGDAADLDDTMLEGIFQQVRRRLKLTGECLNISAACASSTIALMQAAMLIAAGCTDAVLVCCVDLVTQFVFSGFSALQALSDKPCRPFDRNRNGLSLGEGAAALLLMSKTRARKEGRGCLGTVLGWGAAGDASHITAPAKDGCGLQQAVDRAFRVAGLNAGDMAAVSAHGTGTVYNDQMELKAFGEIFGDHLTPIFSIKGAIGHTLGAAGGIEVAVGLHSLAAQIIPPTVGFSEAAPGAEGRVASRAVDIAGDLLLTTNSGFGGINAAIILGKGSVQ
ncbi:MAG: beta-ketoacyl synthase N-terminal-like domain-containing protein, partial [Desulfobacterales bacterium]